MYFFDIMWHSMQAPPFDPGLCRWWGGASYSSARWQEVHTPFPEARSFREWGLWQSEHRTPARYIRLCTKEPYS